MMKLTINGSGVELVTSESQNFKDLMDQIYRKELDKDHVITRLVLNGEELSLEDEEANDDTPFDKIETLEITSKPAIDVLRDGLKTGEAAVDQLVDDCRRCAAAFSINNIVAGGEALGDATGLIQWMLHLIHGMTVIMKMPDETPFGNETFGSRKKLFETQIKTLHDAAEKQDFRNMAQLLEQQFVPHLPVWKDVFKKALA